MGLQCNHLHEVAPRLRYHLQIYRMFCKVRSYHGKKFRFFNFLTIGPRGDPTDSVIVGPCWSFQATKEGGPSNDTKEGGPSNDC